MPAYYIEDALHELLRREAVSEQPRRRYRSEIIIYTPEHAEYFRMQESLFTPLADYFANALRHLADSAAALGHHTAGRSENDLLWLYGMMAMVHLEEAANPITPPPHPLRFDSGRWTYHGYVAEPGVKYHYSPNCLYNHILGSEGSYSHTVFRFGGFAEQDMMHHKALNLCEDVLHGSPVTDEYAAARAFADPIRQAIVDGGLLPAPTPGAVCDVMVQFR